MQQDDLKHTSKSISELKKKNKKLFGLAFSKSGLKSEMNLKNGPFMLKNSSEKEREPKH